MSLVFSRTARHDNNIHGDPAARWTSGRVANLGIVRVQAYCKLVAHEQTTICILISEGGFRGG